MTAQDELSLADVRLPRTSVEKVQLAMDLLEWATSLAVVSEYLKTKGLPHSAGSWDEMRDKRILPAISKQKLTFKDLFALLAEAEEFGRSHTFLYQSLKSEASKLFDRNRIVAIGARLKHVEALEGTILINLPAKPTVVEIREDYSNDRRCWVFKIVEKREEKEYLGERIEGDRLHREWAIHETRAVHVARVHESGFLEIRIQSHMNSTLYEADLKRISTLVKDYLPPTAFRPVSLSKAKQALWDSRNAKDRKIRFSDSIMRNDAGTTISAATGNEQADLFKDSAASTSIDHFLSHGAYCDSSNIWWLPRDRITEREIHMRLSGENNEFAITGACTRPEYEYVLNELRVFNR